MSFRYKSALVSLVSLALGYGWYFGALLAHGGAPHGPVSRLMIAVLIVIVLQIIGHILIAVTSGEARAAMDERERGFDRRATSVGYQILVVGALCGVATMHIGFDRAGMGNAIVFAVVLAECARQAKFLMLHHRAA